MSEARRIKSRAGCQQCKRRKVKCDLGVPGCQQCIRQKLSCPGYQKPLRWIERPDDPRPGIPLPSNYRRPPKSLKVSKPNANHMTGPNLSSMRRPTIPKHLNDEASSLIAHYFTHVCRIAGCFDSDISPFRILAASMMSYSKPVYLLLQASSAAQLSSQQPRMRLKALSLQSEAFATIRTEIDAPVVTDELMISSVIAGLTSAWYDVNDIGLSHVLGSQMLLSMWLLSRGTELGYRQTFILGAYVYWFMISAFVAGDPSDSLEYQEGLREMIPSLELSFDVVESGGEKRMFPHPLTGFSIPLCISIGKVGSLCRLHHTSTQDTRECLEEKARAIEAELLDHSDASTRAKFQDPQDPQTSVDDILRVGEAYRCAGLLQLYATFPSLLSQYSSVADSTAPPRSPSSSSSGHQHWLRHLAFHILTILETISQTSGTRVLQGLPVLIAGSWLTNPYRPSSSSSSSSPSTPCPPPQSLDTAQNSSSSTCSSSPPPKFVHPFLPLTTSSTSHRHWRAMVQQGLRQHNEYVGLQQVSRVLEILQEVWRLDDDGVDDEGERGEGGRRKCDWMVVVATKGLQTLYG